MSHRHTHTHAHTHISGSREWTVRLWDTDAHTYIHTRIQTHTHTWITGLGRAAVGQGYAHTHTCIHVHISGSRDWTVRLWDTETCQETAQNKIHRNVVSFAAALPHEDSFLQVILYNIYLFLQVIFGVIRFALVSFPKKIVSFFSTPQNLLFCNSKNVFCHRNAMQ